MLRREFVRTIPMRLVKKSKTSETRWAGAGATQQITILERYQARGS